MVRQLIAKGCSLNSDSKRAVSRFQKPVRPFSERCFKSVWVSRDGGHRYSDVFKIVLASQFVSAPQRERQWIRHGDTISLVHEFIESYRPELAWEAIVNSMQRNIDSGLPLAGTDTESADVAVSESVTENHIDAFLSQHQCSAPDRALFRRALGFGTMGWNQDANGAGRVHGAVVTLKR